MKLIPTSFSKFFDKNQKSTPKQPKKYYFYAMPGNGLVGRARFVSEEKPEYPQTFYAYSYKNLSQLGSCIFYGLLDDRDMVFGDGCLRYTGKIIRNSRVASHKRIWYCTKLVRFARS